MLPRRFPPYVYGTSFVLLLVPMLLTWAFPQYASSVSIIGAIVLLPILATYFMFAITPLVNHFRGVQLMPFDTKPVKMTFYSVLRVLVFIAGIYLISVEVLPAWRGAYDLYVLGKKPDSLKVVIQDQGLGLSFPPLVAAINTPGDENSFVWFYGRTLRLGDTQNYTLTLLPDSNIVIDVAPFEGTTTVSRNNNQ
jgi:hypothetical protein